MNFKPAIEAISKNNQEPKWLLDLRLSALQAFESVPEPGAKEEEWRRLDLSKIFFSDLAVDASKIPDDPPQKSFYLGTLSQAAREIPDVARPYFEKSQARNARKYDALVNALANGGVFVHVPENSQVEVPSYLVIRPPVEHLTSASRPSFFPKRILALGKNSSLTIISDETSSSEWAGWLGSLTEVYLEEGASLSFVRIQDAGRKSTAISSFYSALKRNSTLNFLLLSSGSALIKSNWTADLVGEGASAQIFGLVKGEGAQHFDHTVLVTHQVPHTQSDVLFKSAVNDNSRSMFTGLIHVWKTAQKTAAYQTNRNLILSKEARADTIPKLEIEADDVKCGHGAAVSNVDPDQIYYLMSRGLSREESTAIIIEGFYEDVLAKWSANIPTKTYADDVLTKLAAKLSGRNFQTAGV